MSRRVSAVLAILAAAVALVAVVLAFITDPLSVAVAVVFLLVAGGAGWLALTRRGPRRVLALVACAAALAGAAAAVLLHGGLEVAVLVAALIVYGVAARRATRRDPRAAPPTGRPRTAGSVLVINPRSGDGRAGRANLAEEARRRGIRVVELTPGDDLRALADEAAETARVIGMAGGDGSQALVAEVAMRHDLPFVCIPAGTRNHFALDLGLDVSDLAGCLDAFDADQAVDRTIDLAMAGDRVFVNNVSLGAYAESVAVEGYREAKLRTMARSAPDTLALDGSHDLRFRGPDGEEHPPVQLLLVSNNPYRFDQAGRIGSRPQLDTGTLGIVAVAIRNPLEASQLMALQAAGRLQDFGGWTEWSAASFTVDSEAEIMAGVDGESLGFPPPLSMRSMPRAITVMVPPGERPPAVYGLPTAASLAELVRAARA